MKEIVDGILQLVMIVAFIIVGFVETSKFVQGLSFGMATVNSLVLILGEINQIIKNKTLC